MGDNRSRWVRLRFLGVVLALGALLCACASKEKEPQKDAGPAAVHIIPGGKLAALSAPDHVLAFGGTKNAAQLISQLRAFVTVAGPGVPLAPELVRMVAKQELGLSSPVAFDLDQAVRFAVVDAKKYPNPFIWAITVKDPKQLIESLPADKMPVNGGWSYRQEAPIFLNFIDKVAVFTRAANVFGPTQAFLASLLGTTTSSDWEMVVQAQHAKESFADDLNKLEERSAKNKSSAPTQVGAGANDKSDDLVPTALKTVRQLETATLRLFFTDEAAKMTVELRAQPGSELHQSIAELGGGSLSLLNSLAPDAAAAFAMAVPPKSGGLVRRFTEWTMGLSSRRPLKTELRQALDQYWAATNGQMAIAVQRAVKDKRAEVVSLTGLRDPDAARKASVLLRRLRKELASAAASADKDSGTVHGAYRLGKVLVDTVSPSVKPPPADLTLWGTGAAFMNSLKTHHLAITDEQVLMIYGAEAQRSMKAWIGGKRQGGLADSAAMKRVMKHAAPGLFLVTYGSPVALLQGILVEEDSSFAKAVREMGIPKQGMAFSVGARDGVLHAVLDLPSEQLKAVAQLFRQSRLRR